jgi:CheY-like chemotaxis protein
MQDLDVSNIHLLLVEDNPDYLELLIEELEDFGYQHIETATDPDKAKEKLNQHFFEIIIADMRLKGDSGGGFVVFDEIQKRNITAVVIILTANDTVKDCRRAFKREAGDYISKNMQGNVFEILHDSIQESITYLNRWGNRKDEMWIKENKAALLAQYHNQYVAVINHQVIEFSETEAVLKERIRERKLPLFLLVIQKIEAETPQPPSITNLLQQEESDTLEFKSTLQWDVKKNRKNDELRFEVLGTIVGFMNHEGGTLLIGVQDDHNVLGLEPDLNILGQDKNTDDFQQLLNNLISDRINTGFSPLIKIRFEKVEDKEICAIDVKRAVEPVFLDAQEGKQRVKKFYIRQGNTTRLLDAEQTHHYIRLNWK